jgi:hypothetical protein
MCVRHHASDHAFGGDEVQTAWVAAEHDALATDQRGDRGHLERGCRLGGAGLVERAQVRLGHHDREIDVRGYVPHVRENPVAPIGERAHGADARDHVCVGDHDALPREVRDPPRADATVLALDAHEGSHAAVVRGAEVAGRAGAALSQRRPRPVVARIGGRARGMRRREGRGGMRRARGARRRCARRSAPLRLDAAGPEGERESHAHRERDRERAEGARGHGSDVRHAGRDALGPAS